MNDQFKNKAHDTFKTGQERERQKIKAFEKRLGVPQAPAQTNQRSPGQRIDVYFELNRIKQDRQQQQVRQQEQEQNKTKGKSL